MLKKFVDPHLDEAIDHGIALWFPGNHYHCQCFCAQMLTLKFVATCTGPRSFTGEDCVEFHIHGGPSVVLAMLNALSKLRGFQHAEPGDFTKRSKSRVGYFCIGSPFKSN